MKRATTTLPQVFTRKFATGNWYVKRIPNSYRDSIGLMQVAEKMKRDGVLQATCITGQPVNLKPLFDQGLVPGQVADVVAADLVLVVQASSEEAGKAALSLGDEALKSDSSGAGGEAFKAPPARSFAEAVAQLEAAKPPVPPNWALISVPGELAAAEALKALKKGLNVFLFSNNVSVEEEVKIKKEADKRGLMVSGADCGTGLMNTVPFGFSNQVRTGPVGIVGASGTGVQIGVGCTQIYGTGGRDMKGEVGAITTTFALKKLAADPDTKNIVVVAKMAPPSTFSFSPSEAVLEKVIAAAGQTGKPSILCFLGASEEGLKLPANVKVVGSLEDCAIATSTALNGGKALPRKEIHPLKTSGVAGKLLGLFSGGTFAHEAESLLEREFPKLTGWECTDYGDDIYTVGRPHPMIDYTLRCEGILERAGQPDVSAVILDVVLGYGAHSDPAAPLNKTLNELRNKRKGMKPLLIALHVAGADADPQGSPAAYARRIQQAYPEAIVICPTSAQAVRLAGRYASGAAASTMSLYELPQLKAANPIAASPKDISVINAGLESFSRPVAAAGSPLVHLDWRPPAAGDKQLGVGLAALLGNSKVQAANDVAFQKLKSAKAVLTGIDRAENVLAVTKKVPSGRWLLHAGPPVRGGWAGMCGPMKGAAIGAMLVEGWAKTDKEADQLAASGAIHFEPCHHYGAVGPMSGIISPSMPLWKVRNDNGGNEAYSNFNEGLGKALRFGAYDENVQTRLKWMRDELAPTINKALQNLPPIDVRAIISQALLMGDECHNRNNAATATFIKQVMVGLARLGDPGIRALEFIAKNEHFFLNLSMASCKVALDSIQDVEGCTIATAMARNGVDFGVRVAGAGSQWFTAPAPAIDGLYFPGYSLKDANPDLGDSAITETFGIGGFAMAAAPAIVRFVGGNAETAKGLSMEMDRISVGRHDPSYAMPGLDFRPPALGIDAIKVADTGISPVINTGIAHKEAGVGQIGAGICRAPILPFAQAVDVIAKRLNAQ